MVREDFVRLDHEVGVDGVAQCFPVRADMGFRECEVLEIEQLYECTVGRGYQLIEGSYVIKCIEDIRMRHRLIV